MVSIRAENILLMVALVSFVSSAFLQLKDFTSILIQTQDSVLLMGNARPQALSRTC